MLQSLYLENIALIEKLGIELFPGFNVLTGGGYMGVNEFLAFLDRADGKAAPEADAHPINDDVNQCTRL